MDQEVNRNHDENAPNIHELNRSTTFNEMRGMIIANCVAEMNIPVLLDNSCTVYITPKSYYVQHEISYKG